MEKTEILLSGRIKIESEEQEQLKKHKQKADKNL